jgi:DNA phosphorothioation-associated putative methyltransferase
VTATFATDYETYVKRLSYGKRLPGTIYLHRDTAACTQGLLADVLNRIANLHALGSEFNVVKLRTDARRLSFLAYPGFFEDPHPVLEKGLAVDLSTGRTYRTDYRDSLNPPILHRKELLLEPSHPRANEFAALSAAEEEAGLYTHAATIGFRLNWERVLRERGVKLDGHMIRFATETPLEPVPNLPLEVHRHRTAITRYEISRPVKTILEFGQLRTGETFFDYGCGLGADVRVLRELGHSATGWDPVHAPDNNKTAADVVNLGYVLNVIEDPAERLETLASAWALTRRLLVVSTMIGTSGGNGIGTCFGDGVLTTRRTFQKYFGQKELQQFLEDALEQTAVPVALGVFYLFRDPREYQEFLQSRSRRYVDWGTFRLAPAHRERTAAQPRPRKPDLYESNKELLEDLWSAALALGRFPEPGEFGREDEVKATFGSTRRAFKLLLSRQDAETFRQAQSRRKDDLLVYLACTNLRKPIPFHTLPAGVRTDIRMIFGSYQTGLSEGRTLLQSAADPSTITLACDDAAVGWQEQDNMYLHAALIEKLPSVLRVYVACAELLYGDIMQADIVKIHKASGKVTFLEFEDFDSAPLPQLLLRTKVTLRTGSLDVFSHKGEGQLLYFKERFLSPEVGENENVARVTAVLGSLGMVPDSSFYGPKIKELLHLLIENGKSDTIPYLLPNYYGGTRQ